MNIDKKQLVYLGIGAFLGLIVYNSLKKTELREVKEPKPNTENFSANSLPSYLKPPYRLMEGEPEPQLNVPKKSFNSMLGIKQKV